MLQNVEATSRSFTCYLTYVKSIVDSGTTTSNPVFALPFSSRIGPVLHSPVRSSHTLARIQEMLQVSQPGFPCPLFATMLREVQIHLVNTRLTLQSQIACSSARPDGTLN